MDDRELIRRTLGSLARRLRLVRAVAACLRFLLASLVVALVPLIVKGLFPLGAPLAAAALVGGLAIVGFLYGLLASLPADHAARLADAGLHFKERLTSARELMAESRPMVPDTSDVIRAQLAETASRLREIRGGGAFPLRLPPEARWILPVAALALTLTLLPPIPLRLPAAGGDSVDEKVKVEEETGPEKPLEQKLTTPAVPDQLFPKTNERQAQRGPLSAPEQQGDLNALFQDTKMSQQRPDFGSFIKQGDDRLKLLARPESIPDLNRDFTQSPYQFMIRRMQEQVKSGRLQGLTWEQIERLLSEMGQSARRSGESGLDDDDLMNELQQGGEGSTDKMMSALSRALDRLGDRANAARGKDRPLREARDGQRESGKDRGEGEQGKGKDGYAGASMRGRGRSLDTRGDPTARIEGEMQDSYLEGDLGEGQSEAYETNLSGPGTQNPSYLPYREVFSRYRQMMEEALTKEPIPFNYREQVKEYFRSLESR